MAAPRICVVGSANLDLNTYVERFPAPGETLHGHRFTTGYGGKGANQAVTAARLGGAATLIARVGRDAFGRDMVEHFRAEGIDAAHVRPTEDTSTGTAVITVDASGRNTIILTPGANGLLCATDIEAARAAIESAAVLVCQQEVPDEANLAAMRIAHRASVPVIYNPAPVGDGMPAEAYALATILCPNETEAALLTGGATDPEEIVRALQGRGAKNVVLTLGATGCFVATERGERATLPAPKVTAVDTTGAGDAFIASLAFFLARGSDLVEAARRANRVAAVSVTTAGTQTSFPRAADLPPELFS